MAPPEQVRQVVPGPHDPHWSQIIGPRQGWFHLDVVTIWRYRDLVWMFFLRDFVAFYKQTVLGPLWYLIQPTLTAFTYYVIFGKIANLSTGGIPPFLFYMSGTILWTYFATSLINNSEVFAKNAQLFGKVYFPRIVVPLSVVMSGAVAFIVQFSLLLVVSIGFVLAGQEVRVFGLSVVLVPVLLLFVAALGMGAGLIVSALTVRFRDLAFATGFMTQLWMFASPVVYSFRQVPDQYHWMFYLNPMTAPIETLRSLLFATSSVPSSLWVSNCSVGILMLLLGLVLFTRAEATAMDTV